MPSIRSPVHTIRRSVSASHDLASQRTVIAATNIAVSELSGLHIGSVSVLTLRLAVGTKEWWIADNAIELALQARFYARLSALEKKTPHGDTG